MPPIETFVAAPERDLSDAIDLVPVAAVIIDGGGTIARANDIAPSLLGRAADTIVGLHLTDLVRHHDRPIVNAALWHLNRSGEPGRMQVELVDEIGPTTLTTSTPSPTGFAVVAFSEPATPRRSTAESLFRSALVELGALAHDHGDDADFHRTVLERATDSVPGAEGGSLLLRVPDTDEFEFVAATGFDLDALRTQNLQASDLFIDLRSPTAAVVRGIDNSHLPTERRTWIRSAGRTEDIAVSVAAPIYVGGEAAAMLSLDNFTDPDAFCETSVEMTTVLAQLVADLIRRRQLEREVRREREAYRLLAHRDVLTGVANRRGLEVAIDEAVRDLVSDGQPVAVVLADVDAFKTVNDRFGHDAGDRVLQAVGATFDEMSEPGSTVGRWGGDEFLAVLSGCSRGDAETFATQLIDRWNTGTAASDDPAMSCSITAGMAWTDDASHDARWLLAQADAALYRSKRV